jgi:beta-lactamase class A
MHPGTGRIRCGAPRRQPPLIAVNTLVVITALVVGACGTQASVPLPAPVPVPTDARPAQAFASDLAPLEQAIRARIAAEAGEFGIFVMDLETGRSAGVNADLALHAASTMKVPVLVELYRRAAAGEIDLNGGVTIRNEFRSIADSSTYSLTTADDSETGLYGLIGRKVGWRDLARRMIVRSSNLATNILIDTLGAPRVQQTTDRIGGPDMRVLRGVEDGPAFRAGMNNSTTARSFGHVLAAISRCDIMTRAYCDEILEILSAQEFRDMIPAGLPEGVRIAHKTGWITGIKHDGGVVMPFNSPPFVIVVLSRGAADTLASQRVAADVARLSWEALGPGGSLRPRWSPATAELLALHDRVRLPAFPAPVLPQEELWSAIAPLVDGTAALHREEIGRSPLGTPLQLVRFGDGPARVLLWSQMHGDETTASRALADIFNMIALDADPARTRRWSERLTIIAVPMLNPDGGDAHRRRGTHGIDINRDARSLATPEGRALKAVQERYQPHFGFNLHDQNPRSRVGSSMRTAAMSLLAPPPDAEATRTEGFTRALHLTAHIANVLAPLVGDHLTRYDDSYNARAFGDGMQSWGVSTVLIETGSWRGDDSKHFLRKANFAALVSALDAIVADTWQGADIHNYTSLPQNGRALNDLVIRGGTVVLPGVAPFRADIAIDAASVGGPAVTQIVDVGDLLELAARDTWPRFDLRSGPDAASQLVWTVFGVARRQFVGRAAGPPQ